MFLTLWTHQFGFINTFWIYESQGGRYIITGTETSAFKHLNTGKQSDSRLLVCHSPLSLFDFFLLWAFSIPSWTSLGNISVIFSQPGEFNKQLASLFSLKWKAGPCLSDHDVSSVAQGSLCVTQTPRESDGISLAPRLEKSDKTVTAG